jgi:hypothetical protein
MRPPDAFEELVPGVARTDAPAPWPLHFASRNRFHGAGAAIMAAHR